MCPTTQKLLWEWIKMELVNNVAECIFNEIPETEKGREIADKITELVEPILDRKTYLELDSLIGERLAEAEINCIRSTLTFARV